MRPVTSARLPQRYQLLLKRLEFFDTLSDQRDVSVKKVIDLAAGILRLGRKLQELPDLWQGDVERAAVPNEVQPSQVLFFVVSVAGCLPIWLLKQTFTFIEPNGLDITCRLGSQFANLHFNPPIA